MREWFSLHIPQHRRLSWTGSLTPLHLTRCLLYPFILYLAVCYFAGGFTLLILSFVYPREANWYD